MLEELLNYKFKIVELEKEIIDLNDELISLGSSYISNYINNKINKEFHYYCQGVKTYFEEDLLNSVRTNLLSDDFLSERCVKLHLNDIFDRNDKYSDLMKAIVGGYIIDNVSVDDKVIDEWLNVDNAILLNIESGLNYYKLVYDWNKNKYKETIKVESSIENNEVSASVKLSGIDEVFVGHAKSKYLAYVDACKKAYNKLEDMDLLLKMEDVVGYPDLDKCINQLQELFVKGFINEPQYKIAMKGSSNGVDVWKCRIVIDGYKESFSSEDTSKKNAKRNCAFEMLKYIMDEK